MIVHQEYSEKNTVMKVNDPGYGFVIQYLDLGSRTPSKISHKFILLIRKIEGSKPNELAINLDVCLH